MSDLPTLEQIKVNATTNLFAMTVGLKQKDLVNEMVKKVPVWYRFLITNTLFWSMGHDPLSTPNFSF